MEEEVVQMLKDIVILRLNRGEHGKFPVYHVLLVTAS
jgi:hypothetical protein